MPDTTAHAPFFRGCGLPVQGEVLAQQRGYAAVTREAPHDLRRKQRIAAMGMWRSRSARQSPPARSA